MEYKGIEYTVVQTANPTGWKWVVSIDGKRTKTGDCFSRVRGISAAQKAIDKVVKTRLPEGQDTIKAPSRLVEQRVTAAEIEDVHGQFNLR